MHRLIMHMKSIKLHPAVTTSYEKLPQDTTPKARSSQLKTLFMKLFIGLCLAVVSGITIMAYFTDAVIFDQLLTGLFIVGCLLFIKGTTQHEKTDIRGTQRKIHQ